MDGCLDLALLLNSHESERRSTRDAHGKFLAAIVAVRTVAALRKLSERSKRLRRDLTGELFKKSARLPLFYQRCQCELKTKTFQLGPSSIPISSLRSITVYEDSFEFGLCTAEGSVQLRVASDSRTFQRWVDGFGELIADVQRKAAALPPSRASSVSSSPIAVAPPWLLPLPAGASPEEELFDLEAGVGKDGSWRQVPSGVSRGVSSGVASGVPGVQNGSTHGGRTGLLATAAERAAAAQPRRIMSVPDRLDGRAPVAAEKQRSASSGVDRSDGGDSTGCSAGVGQASLTRQTSLLGTVASYVGAIARGPTEPPPLPIYTQLDTGNRGMCKVCSMTYLSALCTLNTYLPWHNGQWCCGSSPKRLAQSRRASLTTRCVIFFLVVMFGCNRIPPSMHIARVALPASAPPEARRRLFFSKPQRPAFNDGADTLSDGADTLSDGADTLNDRADTLNDSAAAGHEQPRFDAAPAAKTHSEP